LVHQGFSGKKNFVGFTALAKLGLAAGGGVAEDVAELAIEHVRAALVARYNKDTAWGGRCDAFARVSDHVAALFGACAGAAVIPLRG
jgi:hypothetical protein